MRLFCIDEHGVLFYAPDVPAVKEVTVLLEII